MVDFIISVGMFFAKALAVCVMVATCAAIYYVESHRTNESAL
jgi:hypothetical protein